MKQGHSQVAVVTGAGSGMGREIATRLGSADYRVALVGRRLESLDAVAQDIRQAGGEALTCVADLASPEAINDLVARVVREFGAVDLLVNNAGASSGTLDPRWMTDEQWDGVIEVNLNAVFRLVRAVLPGMLERGAGTIVTVSSLAANTPNLLGGAAYGAAKAGVRNFMTFLHTTYRNDGIRAITVLPGEADTPILDQRAQPPAQAERQNMLQPDDVARAVHLAATLPQRVVLQEIVVAPTRQRDISSDLKVSRGIGGPDDPRNHPDATSANHSEETP